MGFPISTSITPSIARISLLWLLVALAACGPVPPPLSAADAPTAPPPLVASSTVTPTLSGREVDHAMHPVAEPTISPAPRLVETETPAAEMLAPITLAGQGEHHSQAFSLTPGLAVFQIEHPTATPFAVFLLNEQGEHLALLANGAALRSRQAVGIHAAGSYTLHVIAEDGWTARVEQPNAAELRRQAIVPQMLKGEGASTTPPLVLPSGQLRIDWTLVGSIPATMVFWSVDGQRRVEVIVNESGKLGSASVTIPTADAYVLVVQADGRWSAAFGER